MLNAVFLSQFLKVFAKLKHNECLIDSTFQPLLGETPPAVSSGIFTVITVKLGVLFKNGMRTWTLSSMICCTPQVQIILWVHMGEIRSSPAPNILSGPAHLCTESSIPLVRGLLLSCDKGSRDENIWDENNSRNKRGKPAA